MGSKYTKNAFATAARPQTHFSVFSTKERQTCLAANNASPNPLAGFEEPLRGGGNRIRKGKIEEKRKEGD